MKKLVLMFAMFLPISLYAQAFLEISGKVNTEGTQTPLVGSHVFIHEDFGTVTDKDGNFELMVPVALANEKLQISHMGYQSFSTSIYDFDKGHLNVDLQETAIVLDPVVVVSDPWDDFRESVVKLAERYENKDEFYTALMNQLGQLEHEFGIDK